MEMGEELVGDRSKYSHEFANKRAIFLSVVQRKGNSPAFLFLKYKYCMSKKFLKSIIESPLSLHSYTHFNKIENEMFG